jgi:hypothetical protein
MMRDNTTASEWMRHHIYGTCQLFLSWKASPVPPIGSRKTLLHSFRIIEVCRSILYDTPTSLADTSWLELQEIMSETGPSREINRAINRMIDLLLQSSTFTNRFGGFSDYLKRTCL